MASASSFTPPAITKLTVNEIPSVGSAPNGTRGTCKTTAQAALVGGFGVERGGGKKRPEEWGGCAEIKTMMSGTEGRLRGK
jgi:hypothetical protein